MLPWNNSSHRSRLLSRQSLSRRCFLRYASAGLASLGAFGCGIQRGKHPAQGALEAQLPVRAQPIVIPIYPLAPPLLSDTENRAVIQTAQPPTYMEAYPAGLVYHALRLWGKTAAFAERPFANAAVRGRWGDVMFRILTEDKIFQEFTPAGRVDHLLIPSPFGVTVRCSVEPGWGGQFTSPHPGKYLQVMADLDVASDFPLIVYDSKPHTIADVVRDEARRLTFQDELEWLANGLGRYLEVSTWQNRFGEWVSFDLIADRLTNLQFGQGACLGGHIPYALAALLAVHSQADILSQPALRQVEERLRDYSKHLTARQRSDGGWGNKWADRTPQTERFLGATIFSNVEEMDGLIATGHHLEWMTICRPDLRPSERVLKAAGLYLTRTIPIISAQMKFDWHLFPPLSHAAKAVLGASGIAWASESLLSSQSQQTKR